MFMPSLKEIFADIFSFEEEEKPREVEVISYSIQEALQAASKELGEEIYNLEYEILEKGSSGFLGIFGKKPYRILVRVSSPSQEAEELLYKLMEVDEDGSFKIKTTHKGIFIRVKPPKGKGKPVSIEEVRREIERRGIKVDMRLVEKAVREARDEWIKIGEYEGTPQEDAVVIVEVTPDESRVFITIHPPKTPRGAIPEVEEVLEMLKKEGVVHGIKEDLIRNAVDNEIFDIPMLVAEWTPPEPGRDAVIEYLVGQKKEKKFKEVGGRIDFHELDLIENVVKGQVLARKIPPTKGKPGKTVRGRIIPTTDGRDIPLVGGKGTKLSEDGLALIADTSGQAIIKDGIINVEEVYEVAGDVDFKTGNISFIGNVIVYGTVKDTFKVSAGGAIEVKGNVEKAVLEAGGDIIVRQGVQGRDEAKIISGGDVIAKFIERANVQAKGNVLVSEAIIHSEVSAGEKVICMGKRGQIFGGKILALKEVRCKTLGAESYPKTIVEVGIDPEVVNKLENLASKKKQLKDELEEITKNLASLSQEITTLGKLSGEKQETFNKLTLRKNFLTQEIQKTEEEIAKLQEYLEKLETDAKVSVQGKVYPGVTIKIKNAFFNVKDEFTYVTFVKEGHEIKIVPYEQSKEDQELMEEKIWKTPKWRKKK